MPIGNFIVDFACPAAHLIVEVDGSQHGSDQGLSRDSERTAWLNAEGYRVLRVWNNDVTRDIDAVMELIYAELYGAPSAETKALKHRRRLTAPADHPTPARKTRRPSPLQGRVTKKEENPMDLGIAGRKAIVCASSRGLGKACAFALAEAGVEVVINGRDAKTVETTAAEIAKATGTKTIAVVADVATPEGQKALFAACPSPDILVNNNGGPPPRDFRELTREMMLDGVIANMVVAIELIQKVIDPMAARGFGRIINITSSSVKAPLAGLDLSSGARAGLTAFIAGVARTVANKNVTINSILPGAFDTDRLRSVLTKASAASGKSLDEAAQARINTIPARRFGQPEEFGAACAFLCSAHAGYITGQNLLIDGGTIPTAF